MHLFLNFGAFNVFLHIRKMSSTHHNFILYICNIKKDIIDREEKCTKKMQLFLYLFFSLENSLSLCISKGKNYIWIKRMKRKMCTIYAHIRSYFNHVEALFFLFSKIIWIYRRFASFAILFILFCTKMPLQPYK